jgi:cytoskeletal protein CcmA (bactofilin family)
MASVTHILAAGTTVEGQVRGDGDLTIAGVVRGGVELRGVLNIVDGGSVTGDVRCTHLTLSGTVHGDVVVEGRTAIRQGATLRGTLATGRLDVQGGARIQASIETTGAADTAGPTSVSAPSLSPGPGSAGPTPSPLVPEAETDPAPADREAVADTTEPSEDGLLTDLSDSQARTAPDDEADDVDEGDVAQASSSAPDRLTDDPGVSDAEDANPPEPEADDP